MGRDTVIIPHVIVLIIFILSPRLAIPLGGFMPSIIAAAYLYYHLLMKTIIINVKVFIYICFICIFIYLRTIFTEETDDIALVKLSIGLILSYFLGAAFRRKFDLDQVLKIIVITGVLNSTIIVIEFFIPEIKFLIENFMIQNSSGLIYKDHPFQMRGLASHGGAALSIFNFTCVYLLLYVIKPKVTIFTIFSICILSASCIVIGRTGLLAILILFVFWIITKLAKGRYRYLKFTTIITVLIMVSFSIQFVDYTLPEQDYIIWAMEIFTLFDGLQNKTIAYMLPMIVFPEGWHLLFGSGSFERQIGYVQTDIGYLKIIHFGGLVFGFLFYGFFLFLAIHLKNVKKQSLVVLLLVFFIFELKEPFLVQNINSRFWFFVAGFIYPVFQWSNRAAD